MRMIGELEDQQKAKIFSSYLRSKKIENTCEISFDQEKQKVVCSLWVHEEDVITKAIQEFEDFVKNSQDPKYQVEPLREERLFSAIENPNYKEEKEKKTSFTATGVIIVVCILVFLLDALQQNAFFTDNEHPFVVITMVQKLLLFDVPETLTALDKVFVEYGITPNTKLQELPSVAKNAIATASNIPYFQGFYSYFLDFLQKKSTVIPDMFVKIREGQVWRIFTPAILHKNFFHLFFNMIWLSFLGKQIEKRLPARRFLVFIFLTACFANIMQYLVSGPLFLGFSGVIMAMAAFIWMRQKVAPWEGYPLSKGTFAFLAFFVLSMIALQAISFFLAITGNTMHLYIANTAHMAGALLGGLLGRLSFFSWSTD